MLQRGRDRTESLLEKTLFATVGDAAKSEIAQAPAQRKA